MVTIILLIPLLFTICELINIVKGLEEKNYIYGSLQHSLEHFIYMIGYILTIMLLIAYIHTLDEFIFNYFLGMFTISSIALVLHIKKERIN